MKIFNQFIEEARRIKVLNTSHYTSNDSKANILQSGFKDSPSTGAYHPDNNKRTVYTTPSSRVLICSGVSWFIMFLIYWCLI